MELTIEAKRKAFNIFILHSILNKCLPAVPKNMGLSFLPFLRCRHLDVSALAIMRPNSVGHTLCSEADDAGNAGGLTLRELDEARGGGRALIGREDLSALRAVRGVLGLLLGQAGSGGGALIGREDLGALGAIGRVLLLDEAGGGSGTLVVGEDLGRLGAVRRFGSDKGQDGGENKFHFY